MAQVKGAEQSFETGKRRTRPPVPEIAPCQQALRSGTEDRSPVRSTILMLSSRYVAASCYFPSRRRGRGLRRSSPTMANSGEVRDSLESIKPTPVAIDQRITVP